MANWTDDKRRQFNKDWNNDDFLCPDEEFLSDQQDSPNDDLMESQVGEGSKRKRADEAESSPKRQKSEEYFTIKSAKQVNVRNFKTTDTDYAVQFNALNIHRVFNIMPVLNRAFKHLFDRLTTDMEPHDQVRLILNSHHAARSFHLLTVPSTRPFDPWTFPGRSRTCCSVQLPIHLRRFRERERERGPR